MRTYQHTAFTVLHKYDIPYDGYKRDAGVSSWHRRWFSDWGGFHFYTTFWNVCEIVLRDSVVVSAVQTVLRMILCILPHILIIRIFPISYVIRGCLSEYLGVTTFEEVRLYHWKNSWYDLFRFRFHSSLCICLTPMSSNQDMAITVLDRWHVRRR
jgi:hypothetical protein